MISLIVAVARNGVIGVKGELPWHLPQDLAHFKRTTLGKPIIMGRKTHESIGRALPHRENIVVSRDPRLVAPGCRVAESLDAALALCEEEQEKVVIGGATLYAEALPRTEVLYLTRVHVDLVGDAFFPELDLSQWREITRREFEPDERHAHAFSITTLARRETNPTAR